MAKKILLKVTHCLPSVSDINGNRKILVFGEGFIDGCTCSLGQTTFINSNSLSVIVDPHELGVVDVIVKNPKPNADPYTLYGGFEYWSPSNLNLSLFCDQGNYNQGNWSFLNSENSMSNTAENSPVVYDNSPFFDDRKVLYTSNDNIISNTSGTMFVVFKGINNWFYIDPPWCNATLIGNSSSLAIFVAAHTAGVYWLENGQYKKISNHTLKDNKYYLAVARWSNNIIKFSITSFDDLNSSEQMTAFSAINLSNDGHLQSGMSELWQHRPFTGNIRTLGCMQECISDADLIKLKNWASLELSATPDPLILPKITGMSHNYAGPVSGGKALTIYGENFKEGCSVHFGLNGAQSTFVNSNQIECIAPPHEMGNVTITVTNPNGAVSNYWCLTYYPAPIITSISPSSISAGTETHIMIYGSNFMPVGVKVGDYSCHGVAITGPVQEWYGGVQVWADILFPGLPSGTYNVIVTNIDEQDSGESGNGMFIII